MEVVRGNTRFEKTHPVNLNIHERWRRALRDFGLCTPARRESSCEGIYISRDIRRPGSLARPPPRKFSQFAGCYPTGQPIP